MPKKCASNIKTKDQQAKTPSGPSPPTIQIRKPSTSSSSDESSSASGEKIALQKVSTQGQVLVPEIHNHHSTVVIKENSPRLFLLYGIVILQATIFITELITDQFTHSLLILTDSYHHLFNACNAILLIVCYKISNQSSVKNTFGWVRIEVLGMLTTITFIVALIFSLLIEGCLQLLHLHEISNPTNFNVLLIFGVWSLTVNVLYVLIINGMITEKKYKTTTRTERSFSTANCEPSTCAQMPSTSQTRELLEVTPVVESATLPQSPRSTTSGSTTSSSADSNNNKGKSTILNAELPSEQTSDCFLGSLLQGVISPVLVLLGSLAIIALRESEFVNMADPLIGITMAVLLCITFFPQLKSTLLILMQTVPQNVNVNLLKKELLDKFNMIQNIHELHIWRLNNSNIVATCHIVLPKQSTKEYARLFESIKTFLSSQYGIAYVTIQPEFSDWNSEGEPIKVQQDECFMKCPKKSCGDEADCNQLTCCSAPGKDLQSVMVHGHGHSHGGGGHGHGHSH